MNVLFDVVNKDCKIICNDATVFEKIRNEFSTENKAKKFARNKQFIPSKLYAITPTGIFEPGLANDIEQVIVSKQLASSIQWSEKFKAVGKPVCRASVYNDLAITLRDYQHQSVQECINCGRGICLLATGAGKTLIMASLAASFFNDASFKCLILVPDPGLAVQTCDDFKQYNVPFKVCAWTGQHKLDASAHVIIANHDIVLNRFDEHEWIEYVDVLIADEVHTIKKSNKINKIVSKIKTNCKFGFTGTLPTDASDKWNVIGKFGKILIRKSSHELREQSFLTNVDVKILRLTYASQPPKPTVTTDKKGNKLTTAVYRAELDFIYNSQFRNKIIQQLCNGFNNNILILVNHLTHGDALYQHLKQNCTNKCIEYIKGEVEINDREIVKQQMENTDNMVVVAMSSIFSTGINIKNIHMIIFAAGGKSFIRVVQSIGRGLRKNENKQKLNIIDLCDNLKYGIEHSKQRQNIYEQEKIQCNTTTFIEK